MFRLSQNASLRLMIVHGFAMLALGFALLYIRATMTNVFFYLFGGAVAMLLVVASLLFLAGVNWLFAASRASHHTRILKGLLIVSSVTALCGVGLLFYARTTVQLMSQVLAAYAFLLGVAKLGFARSWRGSKHERAIMYVLAITALLFSFALVVLAGPDDRRNLLIIASYCLFMGLQMLLTMSFLQDRLAPLRDGTIRPHPARAR